ncbi:MAG: NfeD family protein [Gammaproteobacteria bacterium]
MRIFKLRRFCTFIALALFAVILWLPVQQQAFADQKNAAWTILQLDIDGAVGPATSDYIRRNMDKAAETGAKMILLRIDTPGGLDTSMREIIKKIIASPVPVVGYVAPGGARAASAGTYILYACHVAAMAPTTNLGAATPVQAIDIGSLPDRDGQKTDKDSAKPKNASKPAMTEKIINDAVAYIRGLASMRGRNADWAEKAVREAASLQSEEALRLQVIDLIAADNADLLKQLNGRKVNVLGQEITLRTDGAVIENIVPDWRSELLSVIADPNIAYFLLLVGLYGIAVEFTNPGAVVPGTVGTICLLLALYAFQLLPVNYAGIALIVLGLGLMTAEAFAPSFGILGIGGISAFVFGSVILIDSDAPGFGINPGLIGGFALSSAAFFILALGMLLKSRRSPVVSGKEEMLGCIGEALEAFAETGTVRVHGEIWRARTDLPLQKNDKVRITGLDGLLLSVTPCQSEEKRSC